MSLALATIRFALVLALFFLLLEPMIRQINRQSENPEALIVLDNSLSVSSVLDSSARTKLRNELTGLGKSLNRKNIQTEFMDLDGKIYPSANAIPFRLSETNFSKLFNDIDNAYEGRNVSCVILASDGIYNTGASPTYRDYRYPVITIGIGDALERNDISLRAIDNNKVVYQGNRFTMNAEVYNKGYALQSAILEVHHEGQVIATKSVAFPNPRGIQEVSFILDADKPGTQRYTLTISPLSHEQTTLNNVRETYLDVIDSKQKILLLAHSPHPDLKAIISAVEKNQNYELTTVTPYTGKFKPDKYSLVIYHQLPDAQGTFNDLISQNKLDELPALYIVGGKTSLAALSNKLGWLRIRSLSPRSDNAFPVLNNSFNGFIISEQEQETISKYPPLITPFGEYAVGVAGNIVLFQKIENLVTSRPLLAVARDGDRKVAVITGEGIWRWRLNEYLEKNSNDAFDSFFLKLIQYAGSRDDRRKFRVYPVKNEFWNNEAVDFETETYNDIYERVYGQNVTLEISGENGRKTEYSYVTSETSSRFRISGMEPGVYKYSAKTEMSGKDYSSSGMFTLRQQQVESVNLTADFGTLRRLASISSGYFTTADHIPTLATLQVLDHAKPVIYSTENISAIINTKWIFLVLLLLITTEWVSRKYLGGY